MDPNTPCVTCENANYPALGQGPTASGLTTKTIRYYEQAGLLPEPPRTTSGYRDYTGEAVNRLAFIRDAQGAGLPLAEIRGILALRDSGQTPCDHLSRLIDQHLDEINRSLAELRKTRTALRDLARRAADTDPHSCAEDDICHIVRPQTLRG